MSATPLDDLAGAIARAQDERLAEGRSQRQHGMRTALLADPVVTDPQRRRPAFVAYALAFAAAAVLLLVVGGLWLRMHTAAPLTFTVGDDTTAHTAALFIAVPDAPVEVEFSDGSRLVLATGSRARVETSELEGGRIVLEAGGLAIDATADDDDEQRSFAVDAGPFGLALADAACDVTWDGSTQRLGIVVHTGRVHVSGPADQAHEVVAGQRIDISPHERRAATPASPAVTDEPAEPEPAPAAAPPAPDRARSERSPLPRRSKKETAQWLTLARASRHREALAAAEAVGFESLCDSLGPSALLQLGDTARFAGKRSRATAAFVALRRRHPTAAEAAVAAYTLGRIAAGEGRHAAAAGFFATYLRERPRGSLAREALGRKLEAEAAAGWDARADATARRYLELHPNGPHADLAAARSR
jgi:TolA-binding protein